MKQREIESDSYTGEKPLPLDEHEGCAVLAGSWAQRKWAIDLRNRALDLKWADETAALLKSVTDATWWIANKSITASMKFKQPKPEQTRQCQICGEREGQHSHEGEVDPEAAKISPNELRPTAERMNDAVEFAASVSRHPLTAEAAILALLAKLYKPPMRDNLRTLARAKCKQATFETQRDLDAIEKLLK